jgi:hypothetical protein
MSAMRDFTSDTLRTCVCARARVCVGVWVWVCVRARARVCVCVCVWLGGWVGGGCVGGCVGGWRTSDFQASRRPVTHEGFRQRELIFSTTDTLSSDKSYCVCK